MTTIKNLNWSDILGVMASGLCAIHCAITPVFFLARPLLEHSTDAHGDGHGFWSLLDYVFLVVSLVAVWYSSKHTTHKNIKWILWSAWIVFATGLGSEIFSFQYGIWLMYAGSVALIIAHIKNYRFCKKCKIEDKA
jgi:hypothetical protein